MTIEGELPGRSEPSLPSPPPSSGRAMVPWYALLTVLVSAVIVGAWWVISRPPPPPPELPEESGPAAVASVPLTVPVAQEAKAEAPTPVPPTRIDKEAAPAPSLAPRARQAARQAARNASPEGKVGQRSSPEQPDPLLTPTVPLIYRTDPDRGRLVQLGAFPTRDEADDAWRRLTRRYPYLRTKPRMVSPVEVRGLGSRPARLYRLQLGTASQAQSLVICQQLERAGQSCVVVYR